MAARSCVQRTGVAMVTQMLPAVTVPPRHVMRTAIQNPDAGPDAVPRRFIAFFA